MRLSRKTNGGETRPSGLCEVMGKARHALMALLMGASLVAIAEAAFAQVEEESLNRVEEIDLVLDDEVAIEAGFRILNLAQRKHLQESKDIGEAFVRPMLPEPTPNQPGDEPNFGYATYDIDGDGYGELFVMYRNQGFCGANGCRLVGYRFDGTQWSAFLDATAMNLGVKPPPKPGSFGDIALIGERTQFLRRSGDNYVRYR